MPANVLLNHLHAGHWSAFESSLARVHKEDFSHAVLADTVVELCRHDFCHQSGASPAKRVQVLELLLAAGACLEGDTADEALEGAVIGADHLLLDALLARGARPATATTRGLPRLGPVLYAMGLGHVDMLQKLLDHGASMWETDRAGCSGLCYAVAGNHAPMIRFLVKSGISPNVRDVSGRTPLASEAADLLPSTIDLLVALGASLRVVDHEGQALAQYAQGNSPGSAYLRSLIQAQNLRVNTPKSQASSARKRL